MTKNPGSSSPGWKNSSRRYTYLRWISNGWFSAERSKPKNGDDLRRGARDERPSPLSRHANHRGIIAIQEFPSEFPRRCYYWVAGLVIVMLLSGLKSECLLPGATLDQTWWKWTIRFSEVYARYSMVDNFYQNFLTKADNFENIIYPIYPSFWKESTFFLKEVKRIQL